jgi:hypothetical protein
VGPPESNFTANLLENHKLLTAQAPFSLELEFDKLSFKAQTIESLTNSQAQISSSKSKCKAAMLNVRDLGGDDSNEEAFMTSPRMLECSMTSSPTKQELKLSTVPKPSP